MDIHVEKALSCIKNGKAAGVDNLTKEHLQSQSIDCVSHVYCWYWTTKRDAMYTVTVLKQCETDQARSRAIHIHGRP